MRIPVDRQSATPLYQQIESFLRGAILSGSLAAGARLPAIRELAADLGVNRITVENAYAELESDGLVESRVGAGTFILPPYQLPPLPPKDERPPWPLWQQELQAGNKGRDEGLLSTEVLRGAGFNRDQPESQQDVPITFAIGIGDRRLFPVEDLRKSLQAVMRRDGVEALDYGDARGYLPLRSTIAHVLASEGLRARPEHVLITAGSQQALSLVTQVLLKPGDTVLVETPTYGGALALLRASNLKIVGIPLDDGGMQVDRLEVLLQQHHPKLIYTIPTFHNPTGTCLSAQRRAQLIALAVRYNIPILEDDFVGDFRYEGRTQPTLKALDSGGCVIHMGTFSKMLMPGLRVGYLVAEGPVYDRLVATRRFNDIATSNLIQRAVESYVTVGRYQAHVRRAGHIYRKRRDAMLAAIRRYMPPGVRVDPPPGGLFIWLRLPEGVACDALLRHAWAEGVTYAPGRGFFPVPSDGGPYMRLNFACQPPELIDEGIRRLRRAIDRLLDS